MATPFERLAEYYSENGEAALERQALIKLRWVAGDESLGRRGGAPRQFYLQRSALGLGERDASAAASDARTCQATDQRQIQLRRDHRHRVRRAVPVLLRGKDHPELRVTNTLEALAQLRRLSLISEAESEMLRAAYLFLRNLIDALRIVRGDASDLALPEEDSDEFNSLARRLGYRERDWKRGAEKLAADIRRWMKRGQLVLRLAFQFAQRAAARLRVSRYLQPTLLIDRFTFCSRY